MANGERWWRLCVVSALASFLMGVYVLRRTLLVVIVARCVDDVVRGVDDVARRVEDVARRVEDVRRMDDVARRVEAVA